MISSLYLDYKNGVIQEIDFRTIYNQEAAKRDNLNEKIDKINNIINNNMKISDVTNMIYWGLIKNEQKLQSWNIFENI